MSKEKLIEDLSEMMLKRAVRPPPGKSGKKGFFGDMSSYAILKDVVDLGMWGGGKAVEGVQAVGGFTHDIARKIKERYQKSTGLQRLLQHPDLADRSVEEVAPYWKLLTKLAPQVLEMDPQIQGTLVAQLYNMKTVPPETIKLLQEIGKDNRWRGPNTVGEFKKHPDLYKII